MHGSFTFYGLLYERVWIFLQLTTTAVAAVAQSHSHPKIPRNIQEVRICLRHALQIHQLVLQGEVSRPLITSDKVSTLSLYNLVLSPVCVQSKAGFDFWPVYSVYKNYISD